MGKKNKNQGYSETHICATCNKTFTALSPTTVFCSRECAGNDG